MKQTLRLLTLALFMMLAACTTAPTRDITVDAEADPMTSFSGFKTYGWLVTAQILYDPEGQWEPKGVDIDAEVQSIINSELHKRGMTEVSTDPDMMVAYAAGVDMTTLGLKESPETGETLLENIPGAALVVALVDADTGYVVWVGEAVGEVQQNADEATIRARIEYAIKEMFRLLPKN